MIYLVFTLLSSQIKLKEYGWMAEWNLKKKKKKLPVHFILSFRHLIWHMTNNSYNFYFSKKNILILFFIILEQIYTPAGPTHRPIPALPYELETLPATRR